MTRAAALRALKAAGVTDRKVAGEALDEGIMVDVIELSLPGGLGSGNRDGGVGGAGRWIKVRHPNGIMLSLTQAPAGMPLGRYRHAG